MSSFDDYNEGMHDSWNCKPPKDKNINYEMGYYSHNGDSNSHGGSRFSSDYNVLDAFIDFIIAFFGLAFIYACSGGSLSGLATLLLLNVFWGINAFVHAVLKS